MELQVIFEPDEISRRARIADFLRSHDAFDLPSRVEYLTLNRRKIQELERFFAEYCGKSLWLPEFRTLRGYFDDIFHQFYPHYFLVPLDEKKIIWTDLIKQLISDNSVTEKLTGTLDDLLQFDHLSSLYGVEKERRYEFLKTHIPDMYGELDMIIQHYDQKLNSLPGVDYDEAPWWFAEHFDFKNSNFQKKILVLDGFYWLYPYQQKILEMILPVFEYVLWVENPAVYSAGWKDPAERNIPSLIAEGLKSYTGNVKSEEMINPITEKLKDPNFRGNGIYVLKFPAMSREVMDTARYILYLIKNEQVHPNEITVVYSDPSYLPHLENTFQYLRVPYDIARGKNILQVPLISDWIKMMSLPAKGFPVEDTFYIISRFFSGKNKTPVQFLPAEIQILKDWFKFTDVKFLSDINRHIDFRSWFNEIAGWSDATEFLPSSWIMDDEIREEIPRILEAAYKKLMKWMQIYPSEGQLSFSNWSDWLFKSGSIVEEHYSGEPAASHRDFIRGILDKFNKYQILFDLTSRNYAEWMDLLLEILKQMEFRDATGSGVRLLEKLETRDLCGQYLLFLGSCKHYFPSEPQIPGFFRELSETAFKTGEFNGLFSSYKEAIYLFYDLIQNFSHIVFSYPTRIAEEISGLSPVILLETGKLLQKRLDLIKAENIEQVLTAYFEEQAKPIREAIQSIPEFRSKLDDPELTDKFNINVKFSPVKFRLYHDFRRASIYDGFLGISKEWRRVLFQKFPKSENIAWSPSRLESLLLCPQKYWYRYWLHISGEEVSEEGLDKRILGRLFHVALRIIFSDADLKKIIRERQWDKDTFSIMKKGFDEAFKIILNTFSEINPYYKFVIEGLYQRLKHQQYIETLDKAEMTRLRSEHQGITDIFTEKEFKGSLQLESGKMIPIRGRIDRVDLGEEFVKFYDYKYTSNSSSYIKRLYDGLYWQLIIYGYLLAEKFPDRPVSGAVYPIRKINEKKPVSPAFQEFFNQFNSLDEQFLKRLDTLFRIYDSGHFYTGILDEDKLYCSGCEFREICNRKKSSISMDTLSEDFIYTEVEEKRVSDKKEAMKYVPRSFATAEDESTEDPLV